jgi:TP901 family phage tail tape measure protein
VSNNLTEAVVNLAADASQLNSGLDAAVSKMEAAGRRIQAIGNQLSLKVSLPLAGIGTASTFAAAKFDKSMRQTAALTSFTADQVNALRGDVRAMGVEFGTGANAAADALFFLATPALTAAQNMAILRESLRAASIGLGEAKDIALGVVGAMNAYAKSGLTAARATEILAAGTKFGRFEAAELVPQLGRLTGFASAMGIAFEDLIGTMSVLTLTGASTAEAATSLSSILSTLAGTSAEGEELLASFGLSMEQLREVAAGPNGLINVLRMMDEATGGNIEQLEAIMPNIRALRGAMIALSQDSQVVDDALAGVRNSAGLLAEAQVELEGAMQKLRRSMARFQNVAISVGEAVGPVLVPAITALTKILDAMGKVLDSLPVGLKVVVVLFGAMAFAIGPVLSLLGSVVTMVPGWVLMFLAIKKVSGGITLLSAQIPPLSAIWAAFNARLAASSISMHLATARAFAFGKVLPLLRLGLMAIVTSPFFIVSALLVAAFGVWIQVALAVRENWKILSYEASQLGKNIMDAFRLTFPTLAFFVDKAMELARAFGLIGRERIEPPDTTELNRMLLEWEAASEAVTRSAPPPDWLEDAREASKTLSDSLQAAQDRARLLGKEFDLTGAQASAYEAAVQALTGAHVDFDAVVGPQGETLRELAGHFLLLQQQVEEAQRQMELQGIVQGFADSMEMIRDSTQLLGPAFDSAGARVAAYEQAIGDLLARNEDLDAQVGPQGKSLRQLAAELQLLKEGMSISAEAGGNFNTKLAEGVRLVEQAAGPWAILAEQAIALQVALDAGKISFEEFFMTLQHFEEAARKAAEALEKNTTKASALEQGLVDLTTRGIDRFVDSIFDAQQSFKEFVRQSIIEVSKLIVKLQLLKLIGGSDASIFGIKIPGLARGGFLGPGRLGLVGEQGPEVISGGRTGVRVVPIPDGGGAAAGEGSVNVTVVNQVHAMDSRDVGRFFEENEPLIAGAMLRATQRSFGLRRRLGGA